MNAAKYIKIDSSDTESSRQTIKHSSDGIRYLEVLDKCNNTITFEKRKYGKNIIKMASSGEIDTLLVNSITHLGRNGPDILKTMKTLISHNINIKAEKENIETLNSDGSENSSVIMLVKMISSIYEHEQNIKLEKQKQGIALAKQKGTYKSNGGNKPKLSYNDFISKEKNAYCLNELKKGESIRKAAKKYNISLGTAVKIKKLAELNGDLN